MITHKRRAAVKGLTLLEVLIAMMLITTTLMSFASVFPAAFKMTRKANRTVQAAKYANAVVEELRSLQVMRPSTFSSGGYYLEDFMGTTWRPGTTRFPTTEIPEPFSLVAVSSVPNSSRGGVYVHGIEYEPGTETSSNPVAVFYWTIEVTIFWRESVNNAMVDRSVSVISARTGNR